MLVVQVALDEAEHRAQHGLQDSAEEAEYRGDLHLQEAGDFVVMEFQPLDVLGALICAAVLPAILANHRDHDLQVQLHLQLQYDRLTHGDQDPIQPDGILARVFAGHFVRMRGHHGAQEQQQH